MPIQFSSDVSIVDQCIAEIDSQHRQFFQFHLSTTLKALNDLDLPIDPDKFESLVKKINVPEKEMYFLSAKQRQQYEERIRGELEKEQFSKTLSDHLMRLDEIDASVLVGEYLAKQKLNLRECVEAKVARGTRTEFEKLQVDKQIALEKLQMDRQLAWKKLQVDRQTAWEKLQMDKQTALGKFQVDKQTAWTGFVYAQERIVWERLKREVGDSQKTFDKQKGDAQKTFDKQKETAQKTFDKQKESAQKTFDKQKEDAQKTFDKQKETAQKTFDKQTEDAQKTFDKQKEDSLKELQEKKKRWPTDKFLSMEAAHKRGWRENERRYIEKWWGKQELHKRGWWVKQEQHMEEWWGKQWAHKQEWSEKQGAHKQEWSEKQGAHEQEWSEKQEAHEQEWLKRLQLGGKSLTKIRTEDEYKQEWSKKEQEHQWAWLEKEQDHRWAWLKKEKEHDSEWSKKEQGLRGAWPKKEQAHESAWLEHQWALLQKRFDRIVFKIPEIQPYVENMRRGNADNEWIARWLFYVFKAIEEWKAEDLHVKSELSLLSEAIKIVQERYGTEVHQKVHQGLKSFEKELLAFKASLLQMDRTALEQIENLNDVCGAVKEATEAVLFNCESVTSKDIKNYEARAKLKHKGEQPPSFWNRVVSGVSNIFTALLNLFTLQPNAQSKPTFFKPKNINFIPLKKTMEYKHSSMGRSHG